MKRSIGSVECPRVKITPSGQCAACGEGCSLMTTQTGPQPSPVQGISARLSKARLCRKWRELQFVCPARAILRVKIPVRLGDLDRVDDQIAAVLVARSGPAAGRVDRPV